VRGKFIFVGEQKIYIRGVTYGPFRPDSSGSEYKSPDVAAKDLERISRKSINTIRTYTVPPQWFLDIAKENGLWVMVGIPWEQHITFLDDNERVGSIIDRVFSGVRSCYFHPTILSYAIGNEIPSSIVRWYGRKRVENFLNTLVNTAKSADPTALVTYVNYPTTEYLKLDFIDFSCFNVYLEVEERMEAYLARLQNLTGNRPLVMTEIGLDSRRNGEKEQAKSLEWQIKSAFTAGCAGAIVFSWTDEWHRGGHDIDDWDFGLTRRDRSAKPALRGVRDTFLNVPFSHDQTWPLVSVVVCTHNGSGIISQCLDGLKELEYPNFEVIIVNDGSTDSTAEIVKEYGFKLINIEHQGLSQARNVGLKNAMGEIVAYIDDDAKPDPHWLMGEHQGIRPMYLLLIKKPNISPDAIWLFGNLL
jgi:hypothetical protein